MESCEKHRHERGVALCGRCGESWCEQCLVYAFGPKKPPYCMGCAMFAGGVRTAAARPALSKRELKARRKAVAASTQVVAAAFVNPALPAEDTAEDTAPATDWDAAWWDENQTTTTS